GVAVLDADTVEYTLAGITSEGTLTIQIGAGALTDVYGNSGAAFTGQLSLDFGTVSFPSPFVGLPPAGSLVYQADVSGTINVAGDTDSFTLAIDPNQRLSVEVIPAAGLQAAVDVEAIDGPAPVLLGTATAAGPGLEAIVRTVPITALAGSPSAPRTIRMT